MDIHFLKRQGHSVRQIARLTGHSRNTVRAVLKAEGLRTPQSRQRKTKLDEHHDYLRERAASGLTAVRLLTELQARGYQGGIHAVRRFLAQLEERAHAARRATVRYETGPDIAEELRGFWLVKPDGSLGYTGKYFADVLANAGKTLASAPR